MPIHDDIVALHDPLFRYARMQLRNDGLAEDVVSETMLAVLEKPEAFKGHSALFQSDGHWQEFPPAWQEPGRWLQQRQFFEMLQVCVDRLSPKLARVFMMREWLEREVDDVCEELGITANNCHVMLYRARMQLRGCVDLNWFGNAK